MKKKLMLTLLALSCAGMAMADGAAESSFTITNDNAVMAMKASTSTIPHILTAVVVTSATGNGVLKIFNSSWTTSGVSTVTIVNLGATGYYPFYDLRLKGIAYTTSGNSNGVLIIYKQ